MTKEKSLSEKEDNFLDMNIDTKIFYKKDVKEAVEKLKEDYLELHEGNRHEKLMMDRFKKRFGDFT